MSLDALRWALAAQTANSSQKLVLISLADRANEDMECYPSQERLERDTILNIKTVKKCLKELAEQGFIEDTGERKGKTKRTKVYRLTGVDLRELEPFKPAQKRNHSKSGPISKNTPSNEAENGLIKSAQKRNDSKNGMIPNLPVNQPENGPIKSAQNWATEPPIVLTTQDNHPDNCATDSGEPVTRHDDSQSGSRELIDQTKNTLLSEYITAKGRRLTGEHLANFEEFWQTFGYKKDKARAGDAWLQISWHKKTERNAAELNRELFVMIIAGAAIERAQREFKVKANHSPIYAERWLSGKRWEDEDPDLVAQRLSLREEFATVADPDPRVNRERMRAKLRDVMNTDW